MGCLWFFYRLSVVLLKVLHDSLTEIQPLEVQINKCLVEK